MENYIVSARKYRPSTFRSVVGQQALTHTLKSAIDGDRLAHAYLFCGPRGVGKTSCARIFAKTINCLSPTPEHEACNQCESCVAFNEQRSYNIVELDAASNNSVDDIRNLIDQVRIPPQIGRYRVFIIDEVHMLSAQAFNAFLKTLEEPPAHAIFILATTEKHKILPTILSRCQIYDFSRITVHDIVEQLQYIASQEGITAEESALNVIAQKADGAMRDALSIFDQVAAASQGNITYQSTIDNLNVLDHDYYFRLVEAFKACDVPQALLVYKDVRDHGFDSRFFVNGLAQHLRDLMVACNPKTLSLLEMSDDVAQKFAQQAATLHPKWYYRAMDLCNTCDLNYPTASNKQFLVELTLIKICQILDTTPGPSGGGGGKPLQSIASQPQQPQQAAPQAAPQQPAAQPSAYTPKSSAPALHTPLQGGSRNSVVESITNEIEAAGGAASPRHKFNVKPVVQFNATDERSSGAAANAQQPMRRAIFNQEMLSAAWNKVITDNPSRKMLINVMSLTMPVLVNQNLFMVSLDVTGRDIVNQYVDFILKSMRDYLQNDYVGMDVKVVENAPKQKYKSPREIIEEVRIKYPGIEALIQDFNLSLH
ncbi:MAG: DNA polymerase III subunit gamma/tau [Muribaculaceae bacterium]